MLKYLGLALIAAGLFILIFSLISAKKNALMAARRELKLITSSGYVSEHRVSERPAAEFDRTPVKVPKRKRTLSKEAIELLDQVEAEREAEQLADEEKIRKRRTEILLSGKNRKKETRGQSEKKGTDILAPEKKGTDILPPERKGTDILSDAKNTPKGTDVLPPEEGKGKGTDVLPSEKISPAGGTDILKADEEGVTPGKGGTGILKDDGGEKASSSGGATDILPGKGTDILPQEGATVEDIKVKAFDRSLEIKEKAFWKEAKKQGVHGGTGILEKDSK